MSNQQREEETVVRKNRDDGKIPVVMPKEYWAPESPYVDAYIRALNGANYSTTYTKDDYMSEERELAPSEPIDDKKSPKKKVKKYYKKHKFVLVLFSIVMLASLVVGVLGIFTPIAKYVAPFTHVETTGEGEDAVTTTTPVSFIDPIYSLIQSITKKPTTTVDEADPKAAETAGEGDATADTDKKTEKKEVVSMSKYFYEDCLKDAASGKVTVKAVALYAMPVIIILFLIGCLYLFIKAVVAAASKKKKKFKLGFVWLLSFLFLIGTVIIGMVWNGNGINALGVYLLYPIGSLFKIKGFTVASAQVSLGLGMWIELILMIVGFILMCFSYKRIKKPSKEAVRQGK